jgi:hypothetical protein
MPLQPDLHENPKSPRNRPSPHLTPGLFKWAALIACTSILITFAFAMIVGPVIGPHGLKINESVRFNVLRPNCSWWKEYAALSPVGCFQWEVTRTSTEVAAATAAKGGPASSCASRTCERLFTMHRGRDAFMDFSEGARRPVRGSREVNIHANQYIFRVKKTPLCAYRHAFGRPSSGDEIPAPCPSATLQSEVQAPSEHGRSGHRNPIRVPCGAWSPAPTCRAVPRAAHVTRVVSRDGNTAYWPVVWEGTRF